jgi:ElaB/YqjD/DUF883 family membrane-anchored ribosome-binding protein
MDSKLSSIQENLNTIQGKNLGEQAKALDQKSSQVKNRKDEFLKKVAKVFALLRNRRKEDVKELVTQANEYLSEIRNLNMQRVELKLHNDRNERPSREEIQSNTVLNASLQSFFVEEMSKELEELRSSQDTVLAALDK